MYMHVFHLNLAYVTHKFSVNKSTRNFEDVIDFKVKALESF